MKRKRRVRRKLRLGRILILLFVLILVTASGYYVIGSILSNKGTNVPNDEIIEEPKEQIYEISLAMVGDNLIHSRIYEEANRNANYNGYDFKPMYSYLKEMISGYDLAYYNQETILGGAEIGPSTYPAFNSPYEVGDAMIDAGFNLVSLATNHTLDRGEKAVINSCNYWDSKEGVMTAGSYCSFEDRNEVQIMEKNNISYSLLSYTYGTNGIPVPSGKEYLVNVWPTGWGNPDNDSTYQAYKNTVREDIERVRDKVDVLMVAMHWGVEYTHTPTAYQLDMAQFLADNHVDIIIGTHPHVVMPVTWIDNTLVIYSLGNLLSAQTTVSDYNTMVGLMTTVNITKKIDEEKTSITIGDVNNELLLTYFNNYTNFKVVPFSSPDISSYNSDYERLYNKYSAVIKNMDENMPVVALAS